MASKNKQRKGKNANLIGDGLKAVNKCKRVNFYNSALRNKIKRQLDNETYYF